jgi:hypothetical protein
MLNGTRPRASKASRATTFQSFVVRIRGPAMLAPGAGTDVGHPRLDTGADGLQQLSLAEALEERVGVAAPHEHRVRPGQGGEGLGVPPQVHDRHAEAVGRQPRQRGLCALVVGDLVGETGRRDEGKAFQAAAEEIRDVRTGMLEEGATGVRDQEDPHLRQLLIGRWI